MRRVNGASVFDGAPVLFRTGGNLPHVGDETVRITAESAIHLLDAVQICELVSVSMAKYARRGTREMP